MTREPVLSAQAIAAAVSAVIMLGLGMAVSLGWINLNDTQMGSIEKFVTALLALVVLHVAAALKHHFIDRDGLLDRMRPGRA